MHISFVTALWPCTTVVFALLHEPDGPPWLQYGGGALLSYVQLHVSLVPENEKYVAGVIHCFAPGCSQSVALNTVFVPSLMSVATDCLCECVDIVQNFTPGGTGHEPVTVTPVAPGPTLIWYWYVT